MVRSKGVTISVKVPINLDAMTDESRRRLRQIVGRDTRVIRAFIGVIEQHESELLTGRNKTRINDGALDRLTMTALKVKSGHDQRPRVEHNFKVRFRRVSPNELQECRLTAVALYESYLKLRKKRGRKASRPCEINATRRIPRWVFSQRFKLFEKRASSVRWWLDLRDSLDSVLEGRMVHDRLLIPLKTSPFHLNQFARGEVKALQIFTDRYRKWWVTFAVRVDEKTETVESVPERPPAVLGIDLGVEKAACATLVTPEKVRDTHYFVQRDKVKALKRLDGQVADLQHEMDTRRNRRLPSDRIALRLRRMKGKRENVAREYDRVLVRALLDHIAELSEKYNLYVALGRLKNIRFTARRGNYRGRKFRGMIHQWAFARITESLSHGLAQLGWTVKGKSSRFRVVPENWTSIICYRCGSKGERPRQNFFHCPSCGHKTNADRNGAVNIAGRLITLTSSLHGVRGLGKWASAIARSARLKARKKKSSSERMSSLPTKDHTSGPGESAAVHFVQSDLSNFGDEVRVSDNDPAVVRAVEILSVAGSDAPATRQEKEARTVGGISSR